MGVPGEEGHWESDMWTETVRESHANTQRESEEKEKRSLHLRMHVWGRAEKSEAQGEHGKSYTWRPDHMSYLGLL